MTDEERELLERAKKYNFISEADIRTITESFGQKVNGLLDKLHDKIDLASWESARQVLFDPAGGGCMALNLEKLKIEELDALLFYPFEFSLLKRLCLKDDYSFEHSLKVTAISLRVAEMLGLAEKDKQLLAKAAALHDVGKASRDPRTRQDYIDDYILKSYYNAVASTSEIAVLQQHVVFGIRDLRAAYAGAGCDGTAILDVIGKHHERLDGSGYPNGMMLEADDLLPQILAFADTIEAMTAEQRTWQKTYSLPEIRRYFKQYLAGKFSADILNLVLDGANRDLIEKEVAESRTATKKIFVDL